MANVFWGILIILLSVLIAIVGQAVAQRLAPLSIRAEATISTGAIYAALYAMFGVSLAFALFLVLSEFGEAQRTTESEAGSVEDIYRLAGRLPEPEGGQIQGLAESYARAVVEEEWPMMGRGSVDQPSPRAETLVGVLRESIESFEPDAGSEQAVFT